MSIAFDDILAARERISSGLIRTPCPASPRLSEVAGCQLWCKLDLLQYTGSFKERGARNALLLLAEDRRQRGVVAASAGNHALGLSYHGGLLEIPVTVVMPRSAPLVKQMTCRRLGANVVVHGDDFAQAFAEAQRLAREQGWTYVHGYDDPAIIAGQGTMGLEILEQAPEVEAILVPVGGGGLIAGLALAVKTLRPEVRVIGVEAARSPSLTRALEAGQPIATPCQPTLADGLAVGRVGDNAFALAREHVDQVLTADESELALAVLRIVERERTVAEGAAAATLAPLLAGALPELANRRVALCLCGGNIDPSVLTRVIDKGLVADGRLCRFTAHISDRPGGLAALTARIAATGASVREIMHDRAFSGGDVNAVNVLCIVETRDHDHVAELAAALEQASLPIQLHA